MYMYIHTYIHIVYTIAIYLSVYLSPSMLYSDLYIFMYTDRELQKRDAQQGERHRQPDMHRPSIHIYINIALSIGMSESNIIRHLRSATRPQVAPVE